MEACIDNKVKRFFFASSIYVYSGQGGVYRSTKQACELLIKNYSENYNLKFTNIRLGSLYGTRANKFNPISNAILQALRKNKIDRQGDGNELRSYINVEDAANNVNELFKKKYENVNVDMMGSQAVRVKEVLKTISKYLNNNVEIKYTGKSDNHHYKFSPFNYKPVKSIKLNNFKQVSLNEGIKKLIEDIKLRS